MDLFKEGKASSSAALESSIVRAKPSQIKTPTVPPPSNQLTGPELEHAYQNPAFLDDDGSPDHLDLSLETLVPSQIGAGTSKGGLRVRVPGLKNVFRQW